MRDLPEQLSAAIALAAPPDDLRGCGPVKARAIEMATTKAQEFGAALQAVFRAAAE